MPHINNREDGNETRKKRLAQLARGPGVFVYEGGLVDHEWVPTPKLVGKEKIKIGDDGRVMTDNAGRPVYEKSGEPLLEGGKLVLGGVPRIKLAELEVAKVRGVEFPKGQPVRVSDKALALKLRGMPGFTEVSGDAGTVVAGDAAPRKRGRPRKADAGAESTETTGAEE